jgi:hypothetical protein
MAEADPVALDALLRDVDTSCAELADMLTRLWEDNGVFDVADADAPELADGDREPFQQMTFTVHDEQKEQIDAARDAAKKIGPFDSPNENSNGNALARVCESFVSRRGV